MSVKDSIEVNRLVQEIARLKKKQRVEVLKRLVQLIDKPKRSLKRKPKLTDLAGLGADLWKNIDPDEYVKKLRQEWE
jgi:hypothetical protein